MMFHQSQAGNHRRPAQYNPHERIAGNKLEHNEFRWSFDRNLCSKLERAAILESSEIKNLNLNF